MAVCNRTQVGNICVICLAFFLAACSAEQGSTNKNNTSGKLDSAVVDGSSGAGGSGGEAASSGGSADTGMGGSGGGAGGATVKEGGVSELDGGDICGSLTMKAEVKETKQPGNLVVVFDRSLSMAEPFDTPSGAQAKYVAAGQALIDAITPLADLLTVGAILFPTTGSFFPEACTVDPIDGPEQIKFLPGADFINAWTQYWQSRGVVATTPINLAFERANEAITGSKLTGGTAVVLFTDGEPFCNDGADACQTATQWLAKGIKTYVVGLPGATGAPTLNSLATCGGTANGSTGDQFLTPADSSVLEAELSKIAVSTISVGLNDCSITLNPAPKDPELVHLIVQDSSSGAWFDVPRNRAPGDGWTISKAGDSVELTGKLCDEAKGGRFTTVRFEYGCVKYPPLQ